MDMLGLKFVDLMLIHWPCDRMEDNVGTYKQLEKFVQAGKARAIGVSNFNGDMLDELVKQTSIKPAVNQVELVTIRMLAFVFRAAISGPRVGLR